MELCASLSARVLAILASVWVWNYFLYKVWSIYLLSSANSINFVTSPSLYTCRHTFLFIFKFKCAFHLMCWKWTWMNRNASSFRMKAIDAPTDLHICEQSLRQYLLYFNNLFWLSGFYNSLSCRITRNSPETRFDFFYRPSFRFIIFLRCSFFMKFHISNGGLSKISKDQDLPKFHLTKNCL